MGSREILPGAGISPTAPLGGDVMPLDAQETPQGLGMNTLKMTNMLAFNTSFEVSMGSPLASNPIKHLCCDDGRMKTGNQNPQRQVRASTLESCSTGLEKQSKKVGSPKNQLCRFPDKKSFLCCQ